MALSLFKDSVFVGLRAQLRMLHGGLRLLGYSIVPLLAMTVPMALLLSQLALWFQARPLHVGEAAVVTVQLAEHAPEALRELHWADTPAVSVQAGPVRVRPRRQVCWRLVPQETGLHKLTFKWHNERYEKELAVGNGFMPVSLRRPAREWYQLLLNPREPPFAAQSAVQSIDVAFPPRKSWIAGSNSWFIYWCAVSLAAAWAARPLLQVDI